jgi:hypothetical protein
VSNIQNSAELKQLLRRSLQDIGDKIGLAVLDNLERLKIVLNLHPTDTNYIASPTPGGVATINISNATVASYAGAALAEYREALAFLFHHELSHHRTIEGIRALDVSAYQVNNRAYSTYAFYAREGLALADQIINDAMFGRTPLGLPVSEIQSFFNNTKAIFYANDISWSALEVNLRAEIASRLQAANNNPAAAVKYADDIENFNAELKARPPGAPTGTSTGVISNNIITFTTVSQSLALTSLPSFDSLELYSFPDGSIGIVAIKNGKIVWSGAAEPEESFWGTWDPTLGPPGAPDWYNNVPTRAPVFPITEEGNGPTVLKLDHLVSKHGSETGVPNLSNETISAAKMASALIQSTSQMASASGSPIYHSADLAPLYVSALV